MCSPLGSIEQLPSGLAQQIGVRNLGIELIETIIARNLDSSLDRDENRKPTTPVWFGGHETRNRETALWDIAPEKSASRHLTENDRWLDVINSRVKTSNCRRADGSLSQF